jgi:16S rRNA (uracil1498-N3)-methyltransferase
MPPAALAPDARPPEGEIALDAAESHHAVRVLRLREGEPLTVLNGAGDVARGRLLRADPRRATVAVESWTAVPRPPVHLTLVQALPKGERLEWILQKAVELGAGAVNLVQAERSIPRWPRGGGDKLDRAREILRAAGKQSGQAWLPALGFHTSFAAWAAACPPGRALWLADTAPGAPPLRTVLRARPPPSALAVCIGPEGDFSPTERAVLQAAGATSVSLGPLILRTETAALKVLSALAYEWLDGAPASV